MSAKNNECRFCLKVVRRGDKLTIIDDAIRNQFGNLTRISLKSSIQFSRIICELCLTSLQMAITLKKQLIENQQRLEKECQDYEKQEQFSLNDDPFFAPLHKTATKRLHDGEGGESSSSETKKPRTLAGEEVLIKEEPEETVINYEPEIDNTNSFQEEEYDGFFENYSNSADYDFGQRDKEKEKVKCFHCDTTFMAPTLRRRHILVCHMKQLYPCLFPNCTVEIRRLDFFKKHFQRCHKHLSEKEISELLEKVKFIKPVYENEGLRLD